MRAAILTIGNEIVAGDVPNSNASWIAKQLEPLGVKVVLTAAVPDVAERIVEFVRREAPRVDHLFVTGGLGGTPDDITRQALAAAFEVEQELQPELAADLRSRFTGNPDYVTPWAALPKGAHPLENPLGGAPGFQLENVWVFPGLPREMEAMFLRYAESFRTAAPIEVWRRRERTRESLLADALVHATDTWPAVSVGSYPYFTDDGPEVEVVLKSSDPAQFQAAVAYMDSEIERVLR
ncbi:MAG TPA: molybdopterin-binding protein [Gaiellaceae bacterium]|nr:molybdopterin-binding protein [Gaiellaceae bacterium]